MTIDDVKQILLNLKSEFDNAPPEKRISIQARAIPIRILLHKKQFELERKNKG